MAVKVVDVKTDGSLASAAVTLESDLAAPPAAIEELRSAATQNMAVKAAAEKGIQQPAINKVTSPYPIDPAGGTEPKAQVLANHRYRVDIKLLGRL